MSLTVEDVDSHWLFSANGSLAANDNMAAAGWYVQLSTICINYSYCISRSHVNTTSTDSGTSLWCNSLNSSATLVFQGTGIYLYSYRSSTSGIMNVTLDYNSTLVHLRANETQPVQQVFSSLALNGSTQHALRVSFGGDDGVQGAGINIGKVGVVPVQDSAFPPSRPTPLPPCTCVLRLMV